MDTKLTLKLSKRTIENAKMYAKWKNVSLSKLVESYLSMLADPKELETTPLVKSLSGVVKLPPEFDAKKAYKKHLAEKYSK